MMQQKCDDQVNGCGRVGEVRTDNRNNRRCTYCWAIVSSEPFEVDTPNPFMEAGDAQSAEGDTAPQPTRRKRNEPRG